MLWDEYKNNFPAQGQKLPLALFPVRLETRFYPFDSSSPRELWVRIYPEPLHIDTWQPALSPKENDAGSVYWTTIWTALVKKVGVGKGYAWATVAGVLGEELPAFEQLVTAVGSRGRALTVLTQLRPGNLSYTGGSSLAGQPTTPNPVPPKREEGQDSVPVARLLPERWVVVGSPWFLGLQAVGEPIPTDLPCGAAMYLAQSLGSGATPHALLKAAKAEWMVDMDEAVRVGMAIKIPLGSAATSIPEGGMGLRVFGLRRAESSAELETLLRHQHYSRGLQMVPPGTATNNTVEGSAGWDPSECQGPREAAPLPVMNVATSAESVLPNSAALTRVLGLGTGSILALVPGSGLQPPDAHAPKMAAAMNRVLWEGCLGLFLKEVLPPNQVSADNITWLRSWFINWVRADGPLPILRLGRQPYGILPVSVPRTVASPTTEEQGLEKLLQELRDQVWEKLIPEVARLDPTVQDSDVDAPEGSERLSSILRLGPDVVSFVPSSVGQSANSIAEKHIKSFDDSVLWIKDTLGYSTTPRSEPLWQVLNEAALQKTVAAQVEGYRKAKALLDSYVRGLAKTLSEKTNELVQATMRGASKAVIDGIKQEITTINLRMKSKDGGYLPDTGLYRGKIIAGAYVPHVYDSVRRLIELCDAYQKAVGWQARLPSLTGLLRLPISTPAPLQGDHPYPLLGSSRVMIGASHVSYLNDFASFLEGKATLPVEPGDKPLLYQLVLLSVNATKAGSTTEKSAMIQALKDLATLDRTEVGRRAYGTLGLGTHRLDAWLTSLATARLMTGRASAQMTGLLVGGYGWVDGLRPAKSAKTSQGYLLSPSLSQATTAALLRSGYAVHGEASRQSPLSVNLSSHRIRLAQWLFEGIRQGQELGMLLGERLERSLHESGQDVLVQPLRKLVKEAILSSRPADPEAPPESRIVDGLVLARALDPGSVDLDVEAQAVRKALLDQKFLTFDTNSSDGWGAVPSSRPACLKDWTAWKKVALGLVECLDAAADVGVAESMHALAAGNLERASTTAASLDRGENPPPELLFPQSPRSGPRVHHRLVLLMPRGLESWLEGLIGAPSSINYTIRNATGRTKTRSLKDAGLSLTELLRLTPERLAGSRLEAKLAPAGATVDEEGLEELFLLLGALKGLLRNARPGSVADLQTPGPDEGTTSPDDAAAWKKWWETDATQEDRERPTLPSLSVSLSAEFLANLNGNNKRFSSSPTLALRSWLWGVGKVRKSGAALWESLSLAEALADRSVAELKVAQLPGPSTEAWAGISAPPESRLSILAWVPVGLLPESGTLSCDLLLLDAWTEQVPTGVGGSTQEQGGLTLHWNSPGARGPQVIALGVAPSEGWSGTGVEALINELWAQTQLRAVRPELINLAKLTDASLPTNILLPTTYYRV